MSSSPLRCRHLLRPSLSFLSVLDLTRRTAVVTGVHACCTLVQFVLPKRRPTPRHILVSVCACCQAGIGRHVVVIVACALLRPAKSPIPHLSIATVFAHLTKADLRESSKPTTGVTYKVNSVPEKQTHPLSCLLLVVYCKILDRQNG